MEEIYFIFYVVIIWKHSNIYQLEGYENIRINHKSIYACIIQKYFFFFVNPLIRST